MPELAVIVEQAPRFVQGWLDEATLDRLCAGYTSITGVRIASPSKRRLLAGAARGAGVHFLEWVRARFEQTGTERNLLADIRGGWRPVAVPTAQLAAQESGLPGHDPWCGCSIDRLLPGLLYCEGHRPAFDGRSRVRYDRRRSNPDAARFFAATEPRVSAPGSGS